MRKGKLLRPHVPFPVQLAVILVQLGDNAAEVQAKIEMARAHKKLKAVRDAMLGELAKQFGCETKDLHLDHDPALQNRKKVYRKGVHVGYLPAANDPRHLFYRPAPPQFSGSHKIKTLVRGDHGQHSDAALARKNKRIARNREPKRRKVKIPQRANPWPKRKMEWRKSK